MRVAIVGSRGFSNLAAVRLEVAALDRGTIVVSGGAEGVDQVAAACARQRGLIVEELFADWDRFGKSAGPIRNAALVDRADRVIAFWDGRSRGTLDTIRKAGAAGKPIEIRRA